MEGTEWKKSINKKKGELGFSLIEVLVAVAILCVGVLATASMQGAGSRNSVISDTRTKATTLAADRIEKLVDLSWTDPLLSDADGDGQAGLGDTQFDNDPSTQSDADHQVVDNDYTIYWNIADNFPINDTKTLKVIVTWQIYGVSGRVSMERVIPRII
ncbi:MAG: hypothetical protein DRH12_05710 [Deltaproteobacteria bacterium]|nr:MAG: hypothetical protein DRH12_05710 [Deltaproteobacteria bacterium]RLB77507.1 MAG: hypothetical protein DRH15_11210 [Deltaproteobacteria bacterium]